MMNENPNHKKSKKALKKRKKKKKRAKYFHAELPAVHLIHTNN